MRKLFSALLAVQILLALSLAAAMWRSFSEVDHLRTVASSDIPSSQEPSSVPVVMGAAPRDSMIIDGKKAMMPGFLKRHAAALARKRHKNFAQLPERRPRPVYSKYASTSALFEAESRLTDSIAALGRSQKEQFEAFITANQSLGLKDVLTVLLTTIGTAATAACVFYARASHNHALAQSSQESIVLPPLSLAGQQDRESAPAPMDTKLTSRERDTAPSRVDVPAVP